MNREAFTSATEAHRRELRRHCYRMLGSFDDAEDAVQETLLRAWRSRSGFVDRGPSSLRAWLYRIATNVCLDALQRRPRAPFPWQSGGGETGSLLPPAAELAWLQPYPDEKGPDELAIARETIELAFIVALQLLPPTQRAVLILRDVLGWPAKETAALLETTVAAANSALQRARTTLQEHLPRQRAEWTAPSQPTRDERAVVRAYMEAHERRDFAALAGLLREDARLTMPPTPTWFEGRDAIAELFASWLQPESPGYVGDVRRVPVSANRQAGAAGYLRRPGDAAYRPLGLEFIRVEGGAIAELTMFVTPDLFDGFGLPSTLD